MLVLVDHNDDRAVRNKDNILGMYDLMINQKNPEEAAAKFVAAGYVQHNPLIANGPDALVRFFSQIVKERARPRVEAGVRRDCGGKSSGSGARAAARARSMLARNRARA